MSGPDDATKLVLPIPVTADQERKILSAIRRYIAQHGGDAGDAIERWSDFWLAGEGRRER